MTEIYHLLGMKSSRDDLIDRMKTGWGCFVLASLEHGLLSRGRIDRVDSGAGEWVGRDEQNFARTFAKNFDSRENLP